MSARHPNHIEKRRRKVWDLMKRGIGPQNIAEIVGCDRATVTYDQVVLRMASRKLIRWTEGERIKLIHDGWGKMPAGTFGTILRVFDNCPGHQDLGVLWDTGLKDCVGEEQIARLAPLEQIGSVA
jgi:hypothetical protein